jgi:hypothetical protein
LADYLLWSKGAGTAADLLSQCSRDEMPKFVVETLLAIQAIVEPAPKVATNVGVGAEAKPTGAESP